MVLGIIAWVMRPAPQGYARQMTDQGPLLPTAADQQPPVDHSLDTALFWLFMTGTVLMFIGAMLSIWWRSRPTGRHRAEA